MANNKKLNNAEKGRGKGVAFAKWAKIDKAQRNMFLCVCGASIVLGITIVSIINFSKIITFNATLISEKDKIIKDYKSIQKSLQSISTQVAGLTNNERLETVGRNRNDIADCKDLDLVEFGLDEEKNIKDFELARSCSALRVIPDAMPSTMNEEATLASLNQLLIWSNPSLEIEGISGAEVDGFSFTDESGSSVTPSSLGYVGASVSIDDSVNNVKNALSVLEKSIRNFDIASASLSYSGEMREAERVEFSATFRAYYSGSVNIETQTKKVCADKTSEKCTGRKKKK